MSDYNKVIDKIKKCLNLSSSSNEHEAAAALRQAQKLMETYSITDQDILAAEAGERLSKSSSKTKPPRWEGILAAKIADAFACQLIFRHSLGCQPGGWVFVGCGPNPEVASYTFAVLYRQGKSARDKHIKIKLKRCKRITKTRRADLFSEGWVSSVIGIIKTFTGNDQHSTAIAAYMTKHYPSLGTLKPNNRNAGRKISTHEHNDYTSGRISGCDAQLNRGMEGQATPPAMEYL